MIELPISTETRNLGYAWSLVKLPERPAVSSMGGWHAVRRALMPADPEVYHALFVGFHRIHQLLTSVEVLAGDRHNPMAWASTVEAPIWVDADPWRLVRLLETGATVRVRLVAPRLNSD